jgi:hypothetical protein
MKAYDVHLTYTAHHHYTVVAESKEHAYERAIVMASSTDFEYGSFDCDVKNDIEELEDASD